MTDEKWKQKDGHAISSHVTDANPSAYRGGDVQAALDALQWIITNGEFDEKDTPLLADKMNAIEHALAQQQPINAELLEALKRSHLFIESYDGETAVAKTMFLNFLKQTIARADKAAPTPAQPEKVDVEALKLDVLKVVDPDDEHRFNRKIWKAIDYLADNYEFVRKV